MILKNYYKNAAPIGVYPMSNFGGLVILDMIGDKSAVAAWSDGEKYENIRRHQIFYTYTGRAYIRKNGRRYYFDQIMRIGGGY